MTVVLPSHRVPYGCLGESESDDVDEREGRVFLCLKLYVTRRSPTCAEEQLFLADELTCTSAACLPPLFLEKNSRVFLFDFI
jgi:hypothetical protein